MIFGAAYSHTDMLKLGYSPSLDLVQPVSRSPSTPVTAPPTAINNLSIPTSYSDFMDQTEDGHSTFEPFIDVDWASGLDDDNSFIPRPRRPKPPSSIEHRAEPPQPTRTNISYPIIRPIPSPNGIKPNAIHLVKDPSALLSSIRPSTPSNIPDQTSRLQKYTSLLQMPIVPLASLKKLAWNGI